MPERRTVFKVISIVVVSILAFIALLSLYVYKQSVGKFEIRRLSLPTRVYADYTPLQSGTIIGPGALGWIREPHHVETLAEVGVSILLFVIGLEFSLARLREIGRAFLIAGSSSGTPFLNPVTHTIIGAASPFASTTRNALAQA